MKRNSPSLPLYCLIVFAAALSGCTAVPAEESVELTDPRREVAPAAAKPPPGHRLVFGSEPAKNGSHAFTGSFEDGSSEPHRHSLAEYYVPGTPVLVFGTFVHHSSNFLNVRVESVGATSYHDSWVARSDGGSRGGPGLALANNITFRAGLVPAEGAGLELVVSADFPVKATYWLNVSVETFPDTIPGQLPVSLPHPGGRFILAAQATTAVGANGAGRLYTEEGTMLEHVTFASKGFARIEIASLPSGRYWFVATSIGDYWLSVSGHDHPEGFLTVGATHLVRGAERDVPPQGSRVWEVEFENAPLQLGFGFLGGKGFPAYAEAPTINILFPNGEADTVSYEMCTWTAGSVCGNGDFALPLLDPRLVSGTYRFEYRQEAGVNSAVSEWIRVIS